MRERLMTVLSFEIPAIFIATTVCERLKRRPWSAAASNKFAFVPHSIHRTGRIGHDGFAK
jgi:hypothetical protein